jgi:hypothetical protein
MEVVMTAKRYVRTAALLAALAFSGHRASAAPIGSEPFNKDDMLIGHIDYVVYGPGAYSSSIMDYVYTYKIFNAADSTVGIDYFSVGLSPDVQVTISPWCSPSGSEDIIPMPFLASTSVLYIFPTGIEAGGNSATLLFASDCGPGIEMGIGVVAGGVAGGENVPLPSPTPEPATFSLLGIGALLALRRRSKS